MSGGLITDYILPIPKTAKPFKSKYDPSNAPSTVLQVEGTWLLHDVTIAFAPDFVNRFHGKLGKVRFWQKIAGVWQMWDIDDFVLKKYNIAGHEYPYTLVYSHIGVYEALKVTIEFPADVDYAGEIITYYLAERTINAIGNMEFEEDD